MRIVRAHSYDHVEKVREDLKRFPVRWLDAIEHVEWYILPQDLSPVWIGLESSGEMIYGKPLAEYRGWYERGVPPRIVIRHIDDEWSSSVPVHESAHALADAMHLPIDGLFHPERGWFDHMRQNAHEYFATLVDCFLYPEDVRWRATKNTLARRDPDMLAYLAHLCS